MKKVPERIRIFGIGFFIQKIINWSYAWGFGAYVVLYFSLPMSIFIMSIASVVLSYVCIKIYDKTKKDLLLIEYVKKTQARKREQLKENPITKKINKIKKLGEIPLFFILIFWDPKVAILYYRKGYKLYNGIQGLKTWGLLLLSALACSTLVVLTLRGIFSVGELLRNLFF